MVTVSLRPYHKGPSEVLGAITLPLDGWTMVIAVFDIIWADAL